MIAPTETDIGRGVVYRGGHPNAEAEPGVITSFNERVVFVRYATQHQTAPGQATDPSDLEWEHARAVEPRLDPRDPDHSRTGIFADHNCWRCDHGAKPCLNGAPNLCGNPRARND